MCGIAGFVGVAEPHRLALVYTLSQQIDSRGGHGAGFVTVNGAIRHGRKAGKWASAEWSFLHTASHGESAILHSRYGTCGGKTDQEAHPFAIKREGRVVLYGAHNGVLDNADDSAKANKRPYDVDSRELFHLLADRDYDGIAGIEGYGTLAWIEASEPATVRLVRMTKDADLEVALVQEGGFVFGSSREIVKKGIAAAGLTLKHFYETNVGEVFTLHPTRGIEGTTEKIVLAERVSRMTWRDFKEDAFPLGFVDYTSTLKDEEQDTLDFLAECLDDGCTVEELVDEGYSPRAIAEAMQLHEDKTSMRDELRSQGMRFRLDD